MLDNKEMKNHKISAKRNKFLFLIAALTTFNIITYTCFVRIADNDVGYNLKTALSFFLFSLPVLCLITSLFFAIIPYQQQKYLQRYVHVSILSLLCLNICISIGLILIILMTVFGMYPTVS